MRVAWKIASPWWKVKPSKVVLTATGDCVKRMRRKPGFLELLKPVSDDVEVDTQCSHIHKAG